MKSNIVVDSSVIMKWLNQTDEASINQADFILAQATRNVYDLCAPELAIYEIGNALLKSKGLSSVKASSALAVLYALPITFLTETESLAAKTYALAEQCNITYYDASFLAVAYQLNATLVTENIKHQGKTTQIEVIALKDFLMPA